MNQAHTVPPVAVPWTSPGKAPAGEAGAPPPAANGEGRVVAEDPLDGLPCEGVQAIAMTAASVPAEIRVRTICIRYTPRPLTSFRSIVRKRQLSPEASHASLAMYSVGYRRARRPTCVLCGTGQRWWRSASCGRHGHLGSGTGHRAQHRGARGPGE